MRRPEFRIERDGLPKQRLLAVRSYQRQQKKSQRAVRPLRIEPLQTLGDLRQPVSSVWNQRLNGSVHHLVGWRGIHRGEKRIDRRRPAAQSVQSQTLEPEQLSIFRK